MAITFPKRQRRRPRRPSKKPRLSSKPQEFAARFRCQRPPVYTFTEPRLAEAERQYQGRAIGELLDGAYLCQGNGWT